MTGNIQNIHYRPLVLSFATSFHSFRSRRKKVDYYAEIGTENVIKEANFLAKFPKYSISLLIVLILVYFLSGGDHINKFYSLVFFEHH
jgi:hypothetical protein